MSSTSSSTSVVASRPDVAAFVAAVRARLDDLSEEERDELVGGLEADLSERLADDPEAGAGLGDPAAYADELRAAAGMPARTSRSRWRSDLAGVDDGLDAVHARWDRYVAADRRADTWSFLVTLRPVWWVFRAWLAVHLVDILFGWHGATSLVPGVYGVLPGVLLTLAAVVASVQIGRGVWWPGRRVATRRPPGNRLLLLGLNIFAVLVAPLVLLGTSSVYAADVAAYNAASPVLQGLRNGDAQVRNVFAYDAQGRPLTGVQLFDQDGEPLSIGTSARSVWGDEGGFSGGYSERSITAYPWLNGNERLFNVFPLPTRAQDRETSRRAAWSSGRPPVLPTPPLAEVPPATLPTPSEPPTPSASPRGSATAQPSPSGGSASPSAASGDSEKPRRR